MMIPGKWPSKPKEVMIVLMGWTTNCLKLNMSSGSTKKAMKSSCEILIGWSRRPYETWNAGRKMIS